MTRPGSPAQPRRPEVPGDGCAVRRPGDLGANSPATVSCPGGVCDLDWSRLRLDRDVTVRNVEDLREYTCPVGDLPPHDERESAALLESVRALGITDALFVAEDGRVVDGKARVRIARMLGFVTVPVRILRAGDEDELLYAEVRLRWNVGRRNLSASARQRIDSILLPALERMKAHDDISRRTGTAANRGCVERRPASAETSPRSSGEKSQPRTPERVAEIRGVSRRTYEKWRVIQNRGDPALVADVLDRRRSIEAAYREVKRTVSVNTPLPESATAPLISPITQVVALREALQQCHEQFVSWPLDRQAQLRDAMRVLIQIWQAFEAETTADA